MKHLIALFLAVILICSVGTSQVPKTISYQGVLTDAAGANVPDGSYSLTFKVYAVASAGSALWTETQSLAVSKGVFSAVLGSVTPLTLAFDKQYWVGIAVGAAAEMTPRIPLTSSSYSMRSVNADTAGWVKVDFGAAGSLASGTPLGNGPGWILKAPNGDRRDFFAANTGMVVDYKLYVNSDGNVGVGTQSWPGGKLGVEGDVYVAGNVTKSYSTGTRSNVTPIAFGMIKADGTVLTVSPNVTSAWNAGSSFYEITIAGVSFFWSDYVSVATPATGSSDPCFATTSSVNNKLVVMIYNLSGTKIQKDFSFVVFKP